MAFLKSEHIFFFIFAALNLLNLYQFALNNHIVSLINKIWLLKTNWDKLSKLSCKNKKNVQISRRPNNFHLDSPVWELGMQFHLPVCFFRFVPFQRQTFPQFKQQQKKKEEKAFALSKLHPQHSSSFSAAFRKRVWFAYVPWFLFLFLFLLFVECSLVCTITSCSLIFILFSNFMQIKSTPFSLHWNAARFHNH